MFKMSNVGLVRAFGHVGESVGKSDVQYTIVDMSWLPTTAIKVLSKIQNSIRFRNSATSGDLLSHITLLGQNESLAHTAVRRWLDPSVHNTSIFVPSKRLIDYNFPSLR